MGAKVSVVLSTPDLLHPPPLPPGADELVLINGYGAVARNEGAKLASGDVLVFTDDSIRLTGSMERLHRAPPSEAWWALHAYQTSDERDSHLTSRCLAASLCSSVHIPSGSIRPFQALRRTLFSFVGGYRAVEDYSRDLALRLSAAGATLYRVDAVGYVLSDWTQVEKPTPRRAASYHRVVPAWTAERAFASTL